MMFFIDLTKSNIPPKM